MALSQLSPRPAALAYLLFTSFLFLNPQYLQDVRGESILAAVYARDVAGALRDLAPAEAQRAEGSVQGALEVADTMAPGAQNALAGAARDAFERGATVAYLATAALAAVFAAVARFALPSSRPKDSS